MALLTPAASATVITFGTGGTSGFTAGGSSVTVNDAAGIIGLTVTLTPGTTTTCPACTITTAATGYGVSSTGDTSTNIDGNTLIDTLTISFSQSVTLTGLTFGNWNGTDDVGIYNGSTLVTTYTAPGNSATVSTSGTSFQIRAVDSGDAFTLRSMTFTVDPVSTPEPATFGMMGVALLGLGFGARQRMTRS